MDDFLSDQVKNVISQLEAGAHSGREVAAAYTAIQATRARADRLERDLVRALRWDDAGEPVRTWAEVARVLDAQLGSRQAAHARWGRLISPARRTTSGDARRGAARPHDQQEQG